MVCGVHRSRYKRVAAPFFLSSRKFNYKFALLNTLPCQCPHRGDASPHGPLTEGRKCRLMRSVARRALKKQYEDCNGSQVCFKVCEAA